MKMNHHYDELEASYLFAGINKKVREYAAAHPEKEIIRLGIGDVTQPLAKSVVQAMHAAADELGTKEGFHGYGPEQGYDFLKESRGGRWDPWPSPLRPPPPPGRAPQGPGGRVGGR